MLISPKLLAQQLSISLATLWRMRRRDPSFPRPIKLTPHRLGFRVAEIEAWLDSRQEVR